MNIKKTSAKCKQLIALLDDPHPGLMTWNSAVNDVAEELIRYLTTVGDNYIFCQAPEDDDEYPNAFFIVHKEYWEQHQHLDDQHIEGDLNLPDCFNEVTESIFECSDPNGKEKLLELGFTENNDLQL